MSKKKTVKVIWDVEAKKSLRSIYDYIKSRESVRVAKKVRTEIVEQVKQLAFLPEKFQEEPYLKEESGNYRYKVIWSYKVIYEVTADAIFIF